MSTEMIATVGRRKRAVARIRMTDGTGSLIVNEQTVTALDPSVAQPLELAGLLGKVDITAKVIGGGLAGQLGAIRHGIARAVVRMKPESKKVIKQAGLLTRDPREKERKKPGLKRARRAPQWAKR